MIQDQIFTQGEADQWFQRNKSVIVEKDCTVEDPIMRVLQIAHLVPQSVLEIGASNGFRLEAIRQKFHCPTTAVEPSQAAVEDGKSRYPQVEFFQGAASALPTDKQFNLVIMNGVFCWIDRATLLASVAEIDRSVEDGGYLIIGDFLPSYPQRVAYHHRPDEDVWTYKQNYAQIFLASNLYTQVCAAVFDHANFKQINPQVKAQDRWQVILLRKQLQQQYQETVISS